jgi:hypothetical protein
VSVNVINPSFGGDLRRSIQVKSGVTTLMTGRWCAIDANGQALKPTAGQAGVQLMLEGQVKPSVDATFAATTNEPSATAQMPSAIAANAVATVFGVYRFEVGPEGYVEAVESAGANTKLAVDAEGRLKVAVATEVVVAIVESASATRLVANSVANPLPMA